MSVQGRRQERLSEQIHEEVAEIVAGELKDPRIGLVTVTRVELTADFHQARIWVSVLGGDDERRQSLEGLASAAGYVRQELGQRLRMQRSPEISFLPDRGPEESAKIESLLQNLHGEHSQQ